MRVVVQRVGRASVSWGDNHLRKIDVGIVVLLGIEEGDEEADALWLVKKLLALRIFPDQHGAMNLAVDDAAGEVMVVSQFTLHASTRKGNRPSFIRAARPEEAVPLYKYFLRQMGDMSKRAVKCGEFGAHMEIELVNDGPVTIIMDSKLKE